jgi:hypothetical protein
MTSPDTGEKKVGIRAAKLLDHVRQLFEFDFFLTNANTKSNVNWVITITWKKMT